MSLLPPRDMTTRPITDRVKESLFAILELQLQDVYVADLFCGTGSLGLEALSRGARHALLMDTDHDAITRLRRNIKKLGFEQQTTVMRSDAFRCGIGPSRKGEEYQGQADVALMRNVVFLDPPYRLSIETGLGTPLGKLLCKLSGQLSGPAVIVVRQDRHNALLESYDSLLLYDRREYGSMAISFLRNSAADTETDVGTDTDTDVAEATSE